MIIRATIYLIFVGFLSACAEKFTPQDRDRLIACIAEMEQKRDDAFIFGEEQIATHRKIMNEAIEVSRLYLEEATKPGRKEELVWAGRSVDGGCTKDSAAARYAQIEAANSARLERERAERIRRDIEETNQQIDAAIDDIAADYKRKAVKHIVSAGPGPRVDTFIMKSGEVVICTTTVTDTGRALNCSH